MIDLGLIPLAEKAVAAKPRRYVTPAILLAVCQQESLGVPYWIDTKPGSLYSLNVNASLKYRKKLKNGQITTITTGLTKEEIIKVITIPAMVDKFIVSPALVGKLAKFRFESGYWERFNNPARPDRYIEDKLERFIYSCSWGMVQFMGPNIAPKPDDKGIGNIKRFMADIPMQLLYGAGMIDDLLIRAKGDVEGMYRGYNSGNIDSHDPAVRDRAKRVASYAKEIQNQLERRKRLNEERKL